jgi:hypothetical protein
MPYWITCDEYTDGPYSSAERAEKILKGAASNGGYVCELKHQVIASETKPEPPWKQG